MLAHYICTNKSMLLNLQNYVINMQDFMKNETKEACEGAILILRIAKIE
jgi:hypothetical protein